MIRNHIELITILAIFMPALGMILAIAFTVNDQIPQSLGAPLAMAFAIVLALNLWMASNVP